MNEKIIRPAVVQRILTLTNSKGQKYNCNDIDNIITAFFDVVETELSNGNSIVLANCIVAGLEYTKERRVFCAKTNEYINTPAHYRVKIRPSKRLVGAAKKYTKKVLGGIE